MLKKKPETLDEIILSEAKKAKARETLITEGSLSTTGKILFASVAAYLAGKIASGSFLKLRGKPEELRAMADAIVASKAFLDELKRPGATIDSVIDKMNLKNVTTAKFKQITGQNWPL